MSTQKFVRCSGSRKRVFARSLAHVSRAAIAACILTSGIASADPAVFFNDDTAVGIQTFTDTIQAADANYNASNPSTPRTSHVYSFDILNTSGSSFLVLGSNGAPSVIVNTSRGGSAATNADSGNLGSDGFTNWSNSYNAGGGFAAAEALGYSFSFFEADGVTPFSMNAVGTFVNDWGTCCTVGNPTPSGTTANASEVYLRFGADDPILLGGISSSISGREHFIGAINDANFFNTVKVIASGNGEYFGAGGYLTFSTVALNSVPSNSSVVDGSGLQPPTPSIPDIDMATSYYTATQLGAAQVNPNFVGGTLRFNMDTFVGTNFTVQSQGGAIDSEGNAVSVTGTFTGSGNIQKVGAGLLVLAGTNTNQGGFTVSEGTLRTSSDASLGGGALTIGNAIFQAGSDMSLARGLQLGHSGSRVDVQSHDVTWLGDISGQGALNILGSGRITLAGDNTYAGGTFVESGTLAGSAGSIQGNILNNGAVEFVQSGDGAYAGQMTGSGSLVKLGAGLLELTGTNAHSGATLVAEGTLRASSDGNLGGGSLAIGNAIFQAGDDMSLARGLLLGHSGSRVDVQSHDVTWLGEISGQGTLNVLGNGRLTLAGDNTYSGGTNVESGTLAGSAAAIQGDILNNGTVEFVQATDGTFAGAMAGTGALRKVGLGVLELSGTSLLDGRTYLDQGGLRINGLLATELLTVADGAVLFGAGAVDGHVAVESGGILQPGNSPGTLYVSGDVTLGAGASFVTEIDGRNYSVAGGAGSHDLLVLTGEGATFTAGGSINPLLRGITGDANNDFNPVIGDRFTVVVADNVAGRFDAVEQPAAGLPSNTRFKVLYNSDSIELALVASSLGRLAADNQLRSNAVAAGYGIDLATGNGEQASGVLESLLAGFDGLDQAQAGAALASLAGDFHAHILESTESTLAASDATILSVATGARSAGGIDNELRNGVRVWSRVEARGATYDADRASVGFDEDVYGVVLGATFVNRKDLKIGVAGSYKTAELYNDTASGATTHMLSAYAYASKAVLPRMTVSGLVGYTAASPKTARSTILANAVVQAKSEEDVSILHAQMEARYELVKAGKTSVDVVGGLRSSWLEVGAYGEKASASYAALSLNGESRTTVQTKLGAEVSRSVAGVDLSVFSNWMRDVGDDPTVERTASLGSATWQVQSVDRGLDTVDYGFSARREINNRLGLELEYTGRYNAANYDSQQVMIGINYAW